MYYMENSGDLLNQQGNVFTGKNTLVIGGSGGIGAGLCRRLAASGALLTVHGGHESEKFDKLIEELSEISTKSKGNRQKSCKTEDNTASIRKLVYNFSSTSTIKTFSPTINDFLLLEQVKSADIICVCFGPFLQKPLHCMTPEEWTAVTAFNFMLPGMLVSTVLPHMIKAQWGRILLFGGTRTDFINGFRTNAAYAAAKTGICSLVKSVALNYASMGITANAILPGFTNTEYLEDSQKKALEEKMPLKELISIENISDAGFFLLTQKQMNGVLLPVDGGWSPS